MKMADQYHRPRRLHILKDADIIKLGHFIREIADTLEEKAKVYFVKTPELSYLLQEGYEEEYELALSYIYRNLERELRNYV
ncbi:MAG: hypothetical protein WC102_04865 [Saccharofermentanales bacterium]